MEKYNEITKSMRIPIEFYDLIEEIRIKTNLKKYEIIKNIVVEIKKTLSD